MKTRNKTLNNKMVFVLFIAFLLLMYFAENMAPFPPNEINMLNRFAEFSWEHLLGTDYLGRDVLSRIMAGASTTVITSLLILICSVTIGVTLGLIAGFLGGTLEWIIMRLVDTCMIFPSHILAIVLTGILGGGIFNLVVSVAFIKWFAYARLCRSIVLAEKQKDYISVAKISGVSTGKLLWKHLIPHVTGNVIALAIVDIGKIVLIIAFLSFLGLGIKPPQAEWGSMLSEGRVYFALYPRLMVVPGMALFLSVLVFNLFGSYITAIFDVKKNVEKAGVDQCQYWK